MKQLLAWTGSADSTIASEAVIYEQGAWANIAPKRNRREPICFSPHLWLRAYEYTTWCDDREVRHIALGQVGERTCRSQSH
jgi:hypothetical protein